MPSDGKPRGRDRERDRDSGRESGRGKTTSGKKSKKSPSRSPAPKRSKSRGRDKGADRNGGGGRDRDRDRGRGKGRARDKGRDRAKRSGSRRRDDNDGYGAENGENEGEEEPEFAVAELRKGDVVECRHGGGPQYYPGVVERVSSSKEKYDVLYDDGDREKGVKRLRIRFPGEQQPMVLEAGTLCEARHEGGNVCFDGVIAKVHPDAGDGHTYDITYDDGDQEARVHRDHIFVVCVAGGDYDNDVAKDDPWPGEAEAEDEGEAEGQGEHEGEDEGDGQDEDEAFDGGGGTDEVGDQSGSPAATRHIDAVKEEEEKTDRRAPAEPNSTAASSKSKQYGKASQRIAPSNGGSSSSPPLGGGEAFGLSRALQADVDKGGGSGGSEKKKKGKEKRNGELKRKESILNWGTQQFIETAGIDASINHLGAALSTDKDLAGLVNEFKQKKTKKISIPVLNLLMVKSLYSPSGDSESVHLLGTMVQQQIGIYSEKEFLFGYRFNDTEAGEGTEYQCSLRKRIHMSDPLPITKATFSVNIPLKVQTELDQFPFRLVKASATVNLNSVVFPGDKNSNLADIELMPNMLLSTLDERHIFAIKCSDHFEQEAADDMTTRQRHNFLERVYARDIDHVEHLTMLPMPPSYEVEWTNAKRDKSTNEITESGRCEKFEVAFYLEEPAIAKFINVLFPMCLIYILTFINVTSGFTSLDAKDNWDFVRYYAFFLFDRSRMDAFFNDDYDDDERFEGDFERVSIADYLEIASGIALATILLLPQLMDVRSIHPKFTYNHIYIICVFLSLGMASVPPSFCVFRDSARIVSLVPVVGVCCLALTFFYPVYNRWSYKRIRGQLLQVEPETAASLEKHSKRVGRDGALVENGLNAVSAIVGLPPKHRVRFIGKEQFKIDKHLEYLSEADPHSLATRVAGFQLNPKIEKIKTGKYDDQGRAIQIEKPRQHPIWRSQGIDDIDMAKYTRIGMGINLGNRAMRSEQARRADAAIHTKIASDKHAEHQHRMSSVGRKAFGTPESMPESERGGESIRSMKSWMRGGPLNSSVGAPLGGGGDARSDVPEPTDSGPDPTDKRTEDDPMQNLVSREHLEDAKF